MDVTHSMVERFGLFTIIVLGEVIVGVVDGLFEAELTPVVVVTGLLGLMVGFAFWWTYFDFVGRRLPQRSRGWAVGWVIWHAPVTMSIAASGAAMVSLIERGDDPSAPIATAWLLSGSVAVGLVGLAFLVGTLADYERLPSLYRPVSRSILITAGIAVLIGWAAPRPWLLALSVLGLLTINWLLAVWRMFNLPDPSVASPNRIERA